MIFPFSQFPPKRSLHLNDGKFPWMSDWFFKMHILLTSVYDFKVLFFFSLCFNNVFIFADASVLSIVKAKQNLEAFVKVS